MTPPPIRHGTTTGYKRGCRCEECRHVWNAATKFYMQKMRDKKKAV